MHLEDLPIVDLEVTDERFEGMKFTGTAESIYHEMKALKPELFANETEVDLDLVNGLEKRQSVSIRFLGPGSEEGEANSSTAQLRLVQWSERSCPPVEQLHRRSDLSHESWHLMVRGERLPCLCSCELFPTVRHLPVQQSECPSLRHFIGGHPY